MSKRKFAVHVYEPKEGENEPIWTLYKELLGDCYQEQSIAFRVAKFRRGAPSRYYLKIHPAEGWYHSARLFRCDRTEKTNSQSWSLTQTVVEVNWALNPLPEPPPPPRDTSDDMNPRYVGWG